MAIRKVLCAAALFAVEGKQLSEGQLSQLQKITRGEESKRKVELVLAHFNEDVSWSDPYASVRTVYCKGRPVPGCTPLQNVGREGHTYLHHIVKHYDNLADWTVFSQAGPPSTGYNGHRMGGGHMQPGVSFHDYLLRDEKSPDRDAKFVFTGAMQLSSLFHTIRSSYLFPPAAPKDQLEVSAQCPNIQTKLDRWERLDLPEWFHAMMAEKCSFPAGGLQAHLAQYWRNHIKAKMPKDDMIFFTQGARFAVSRERLQQRSREEYMDLLRLVSENKDPCANYMNEWLWFYIMGKPQEAPCAVDDVDTEAPESAAVRFLSGGNGTTGSTTGGTTSSSNGTTGSTTGGTTGGSTSSGNGSSTSSGNGTGTSSGDGDGSGSTGAADQASGAFSNFGLQALAAGVAATWVGMLAAQ